MSLHTLQASPLKFRPPVVVTAAYDAEEVQAAKKTKPAGEYYVEYDEDKELWCVFNTEDNKARSTWSNEPEAKKDAAELNKKQRASTEVQARIKGLDEYAWFTFTRVKPIKVVFKVKEYTVSKGDVFGVRWSSNKKDKRLVLARPDAGMTRVITITNSPELESTLEKFSVPSRAEIAEEFMTAVTASTRKQTMKTLRSNAARVQAGKDFDLAAFLKHCGVTFSKVRNVVSDAAQHIFIVKVGKNDPKTWMAMATKICAGHEKVFGKGTSTKPYHAYDDPHDMSPVDHVGFSLINPMAPNNEETVAWSISNEFEEFDMDGDPGSEVVVEMSIL